MEITKEEGLSVREAFRGPPALREHGNYERVAPAVSPLITKQDAESDALAGCAPALSSWNGME